MTRPPFRSLLVANRGEIALRVIRTAREMGIETVAVYSEADRNALHVRRADRAVCIGPPEPAKSYLDVEGLIEVARGFGCEAVHPGYGFLAENADFARACAEAGLVFVGPPPEAIEAMGDKLSARRIAAGAGLPVVPGAEEESVDLEALRARAAELGYPVMLKAAAGGGGKGIRIVRSEAELAQAAELARAEAHKAFGDGRVYLEKLLVRPRHVEIQVMADAHGGVVHYAERECSVQRRHQKLVEESPCMALTPALREEMGDAACRLARAVDYRGAGTVEFLLSEGRFYFLEMNTRLQVEHPVTEMRFGVDLVREQIRMAAGGPVAIPPRPRGHAIEVRVNAEDPATFFPSLGTITRMNLPGGPGVRMDSALFRGLEVTPHYDSMLAKLIVHAEDRAQAIERARRALAEMRIVGVATSAGVALHALDSDTFRSGDYDTGILQAVDSEPTPDVVELASLAAALARFTGTERIERRSEDGAAVAASPWTLAGRFDLLGRGGVGRPR